MQKIRIDSIGYDPKYYPRQAGQEDWITVARYAETLRQNPEKANSDNLKNKPFPPIIVVRATAKKKYKYLLLDGLHRTKALKQRKFLHIYAEIEKLPESKWLARATELNADSKRPLSDMDIASIIIRLEGNAYPLSKISDLTGKTVERLEKIKIERITKIQSKPGDKFSKTGTNGDKTGVGTFRPGNGESIILKAPYKQFSGTSRAEELEPFQSRFNDRNCSQILNAAADLLESDGLDLTDPKTIEGLDRLQIAANEYQIY